MPLYEIYFQNTSKKLYKIWKKQYTNNYWYKWFSARDIGIALGYSNPKESIRKNVDKSDKKELRNINSTNNVEFPPRTIFLTEAGLYSLILKSRFPKTKKIQRLDN